MRTRNPFYFLAAFLSAVFAITIMALLASMLGEPTAPVTVFLDEHGTTLILWEVGLILVFGITALVVDRRQLLREAAQDSAGSETGSGQT